ncbi:MAG TPA: FAD-dependent oxidoreductase [Leptolyngbyaceae cyanobacterium M65_K2018_010]|nr:FAD-dependent oxidoreductase [Leptolyngbyaceae cyanobacterium M65_K2018_010]
MKIVVVGGVAGGASTAARARRLNEQAEIVVLERDHYVSYANCGLPYHIGGVIPDRQSLLVQTPEKLKQSLNLDVRVGHEVTTIDRSAKRVHARNLQTGETYIETYDKLVLSLGASPIRPNLPGIDHPQIYVLRNIPDMDAIMARLGPQTQRAIVIGGGYIGVEVAENLVHLGLRVHLVEMMDQIMATLDIEMARDLQYHMADHGVTLHLGTAAESFEEVEGQLRADLSNGEQLVADLVVMAVGVRPNTALAQQAGLPVGPRGGLVTDPHMRTIDPDIYAVGDMVETTHTVTGQPTLAALAGPANRQGRIAADNICGRDSAYTSTQGTAVVKLFDMVGGGTGASERMLRQANLPYGKVYLHPSGHATYYPGTAAMHMKVLFSPDSGKLLGAQVVGFDGIDKRIDVLATALRAGMTVYDLEHLELSYAPPFGSAKDAVNMAGFLAANLLRGDYRPWYAEDYPEKTNLGHLIDVRTAREYEEWHIPGAINLPLDSLRDRSGEIPADGPLYVYCRVGFRGYLAARILMQRGFDPVFNLSGGALTFSSFHPTVYSTGKADYPFVAHAEDAIAEQILTGV